MKLKFTKLSLYKKKKHEICFSIAPIEVYLLCDAAWSLKVYNALI